MPITVTFTSPVDVTGTPQLTLNDGGIASYASGSGTATLTFDYTVGTGENTAQLDYASTSSLSLNGGTIEDASSNPAALTLPATGTDGLAAQNVVIDTVAPTASVNAKITNDTTPTVTGTVTDPSPSGGIASVTIVVDSQTVPATVTGGTWSATDSHGAHRRHLRRASHRGRQRRKRIRHHRERRSDDRHGRPDRDRGLRPRRRPIRPSIWQIRCRSRSPSTDPSL